MRPPRQVARRPLALAARRGLEESPGSTGIRCRPTAGEGNLRESATESRPPIRFRCPLGPVGKGERVRQERTAPPATGAAWQTPPGARPNRGGRRRSLGNVTRGRSRPATRVGRVRRAARRVPEEWSSHPRVSGGGQNPAYRPPGAPFPQFCPQSCQGMVEPLKEQLGNVDRIPLTIRHFLESARVFKLNL